MFNKKSHRLAQALVLLSLAGLGGCAPISYYAHLAKGQYELLTKREDIADIVGDQQRDPELRQRLQKVQDARRYAVTDLGLPDNDSYTEYTDLGRPYVVWNVFAARRYSVAAYENCFPIVGCLAYRGYFSEKRAQAEAERLRAQELDVYVSGVPAYSTLGWFDDPVLNSMMRWNDEWLIGTLFHELAHQKLYVKNDSAFNESFASFVEEEGLRQYQAAHGGSDEAHRLQKKRQQEFTTLLLRTRDRLAIAYSGSEPVERMQARKEEIIARLRREYQELRDGPWGGWTGYDRWFAGEINNASLLPFALYDGWVPAFGELFKDAGGDWSAFYKNATDLGSLPEADRELQLQKLNERARAAARKTP